MSSVPLVVFGIGQDARGDMDLSSMCGEEKEESKKEAGKGKGEEGMSLSLSLSFSCGWVDVGAMVYM